MEHIPGGSGILSQDAYNVLIRITHTGDIGTAKYRIQIGDDYTSEESTVQESVPLIIKRRTSAEPTGLTITFPAGTYNIGDTYAFSTQKEWEVVSSTNGTGKVYMAGVPEVDLKFNLMMRIVQPGHPGTATYQISTDNGMTWEEEKKIPASGAFREKSVQIMMTDSRYEEGDTWYAEIEGKGRTDYTLILVAGVIAVILAVLLGLYLMYRRRRAGKERYNLQ